MSLLYFAYGSNMLDRRLRHETRCPGARPVSVATLAGAVLRFHKRGADGSGKCDVRRWDGGPAVDDGTGKGVVHGVLYQLGPVELERLDRVEGPGYRRELLEVGLPGGEPREAFTYLAHDHAVDPEALPFAWYRDLVIAGARQHGLPAPYRRRLAEHPAVADPDPERDARERLALGAWPAGETGED